MVCPVSYSLNNGKIWPFSQNSKAELRNLFRFQGEMNGSVSKTALSNFSILRAVVRQEMSKTEAN